MSHFTTIKTALTVGHYLLAAVRSLGYPTETGKVTVRGYSGGKAPAEIRVSTKSSGYDIGFRKVDGSYQIVADWWGIRDVSQETFVNQVTQRYAYYAARASLEQKGFTLATEKVTQDGTIHLLLNRVG